MKQPNEKTFCVAPWFQIRNENNLTKRVCCAIDLKTATDSDPFEHLNSEQNLSLKQNLHKGIKDARCKKCWNDEENNIKSLRQSFAGVLLQDKLIKESWLKSYFSRKDDWQSDKILMADIQVGNTCNYACVMCIPDDSSLIYNFWTKHKDSEFVKEKLKKDPSYLDRIKANSFKNKRYHEYLDSLLTHTNDLRQLQLLGGEPLLDKKLLGKLAGMDDKTKSSMSLLIVTNGSVDLNQVADQLGQFKRIHFIISLEGVDVVQDYARYGSEWKFVENNILSFKRNQTRTIQINHTLQVTTILGLKDLVQWCNKHDLPFSCGIVYNPDYLGPKAIPPKIKQSVVEMLKNTDFHSNGALNLDLGQHNSEDLVNRIKHSGFEPMLFTKFKRYIDWYETGKNIPKLKSIFPELYT